MVLLVDERSASSIPGKSPTGLLNIIIRTQEE